MLSAQCGAAAAAYTSAHSTYSQTGSFGTSIRAGAKAYATATISAGVFHEIGLAFPGEAANSVGHIGAHAFAGGVLGVLQGGKFGHGFISAGVAKAVTPKIGKWDSGAYGGGKDIGQAAAAAVVGGTTSVITGGKFANGAITAAYANLYNAQGDAQKEEINRPQQCGAGPVTCTANGTGGATAPSDHPRWPGKGYTDDGRKIALYSCSNSGGSCSFHAPSNDENVLGAVLKTTVTPSFDLATYADRIGSFTVDPSPGFLEKYLGIGPSDFVEELRKNQKVQ